MEHEPELEPVEQASLLDCITGRLLERMKKNGGLVVQSKISETPLPLTCCCRSFQFEHGLERHAELRSEHDWRTWQQRVAEGGRP